MREFRLYNDVNKVPMEWNLFGVRVPIISIVILVLDLIVSIVLAETVYTRVFGDNLIATYLTAAIPGLIVAAVVVTVTVKFSQMGKLPMFLQMKVLYRNAKEPDVFNFTYEPETD